MPESRPHPIASTQVFLDAEFTSLQRPELLALGLCTSDGREHYVELDLHSPAGRAAAAKASTFVHDTVLPQFGLLAGQATDRKAMGRAVALWLTQVGPAEVVYDYPVDLQLLERALRAAGEWQRVRALLRPVEIGAIVDTPEAMAAAERSWRASERQGLWRHHALADARALRAIALDTDVGRAELDRLTGATG